MVHTARWPREGLSLQGKRVGVVGTGATGVQVIQTIAAEVGELFVFQRTANYTIPMNNKIYDDADRERLRARYPETREIVKHTFIGFDTDLEPRAWSEVSPAGRRELLERLWTDGSLNFWTSNFREMLVDPVVSAEVTAFVKEKMRARIRKPELAKKLVPDDHYFGTRRTPLDLGYLEAYDRPNVHLIDIKESPIVKITEKGVTTANGDYPLDVLIFATGFDAGTGTYARIDIRGREGRSLQSIWSRDIRTAMGLQVHGFPNLFLSAAPLSPGAAFCNVPTCAQQQVDWISDCIAYVRKQPGAQLIEPTADFEAKWVAHHDELADATLLKDAKSWWRGSNIDGKQNRLLAYIGGVGGYRKLCDDVAARGYEGFAIS